MPDPAQFDPFRETWCTLADGRGLDRVAITRESSRVLGLLQDGMLGVAFKEWRIGLDGPIHAGHFLEQRRPVTLMWLSFVEKYEVAHGLLPRAAISISESKTKLWSGAWRERLRGGGDQH